MEKCTKCNSHSTKVTERKTTKGYKVQVVYCDKCRSETRVTLITTEK